MISCKYIFFLFPIESYFYYLDYQTSISCLNKCKKIFLIQPLILTEFFELFRANDIMNSSPNISNSYDKNLHVHKQNLISNFEENLNEPIQLLLTMTNTISMFK
jgi:hypothetical protein